MKERGRNTTNTSEYKGFSLTDSQGEAFGTTFWMELALGHQHINSEVYNKFIHRHEEVSKTLTGMITHSEKLCY